MKPLFLAMGLLISSMTMGQALKKESNQPSEKEILSFIKNPDDRIGSFRGWKEFKPSKGKEPLNLDFFDTKGYIYYSIGNGEEGGETASYKVKNNKIYITIISAVGKSLRTETYTVKIKKGKTPKEDQLILINKVFRRAY